MQTVFEIGTKTNSTDYTVMKAKRNFHKNTIKEFHKKVQERNDKAVEQEQEVNESALPKSSEAEIETTFNEIIKPKKRNMDLLYQPKVKKRKTTFKDEEHYIPHLAPDRHTEEG